MRTIGRWVTVLTVVGVASTGLGASQDSTTGLLKAERVRSSIRLILNESGEKPAVDYQLPGDPRPPQPLSAGPTFVANHRINVTYAALNPLAVQVTSSLATAPDPADAAVGKLGRGNSEDPEACGP